MPAGAHRTSTIYIFVSVLQSKLALIPVYLSTNCSFAAIHQSIDATENLRLKKKKKIIIFIVALCYNTNKDSTSAIIITQVCSKCYHIPSISIDLLCFQISMFHHLLSLALGIKTTINILQTKIIMAPLSAQSFTTQNTCP